MGLKEPCLEKTGLRELGCLGGKTEKACSATETSFTC